MADRESVPAVSHIDHVGIAVHDADTAMRWYIDHFDRIVVHDEALPDVGVRLVYLGPGPTMLQLLEPVGPGVITDFLASTGEGLHHVCFAVHDIPALLTAVPGAARSVVFMGGRGRRACFLDARPNKVLVELTEIVPWAQRHVGAAAADGPRP